MLGLLSNGVHIHLAGSLSFGDSFSGAAELGERLLLFTSAWLVSKLF
jgi:hypothetical protein